MSAARQARPSSRVTYAAPVRRIARQLVRRLEADIQGSLALHDITLPVLAAGVVSAFEAHRPPMQFRETGWRRAVKAVKAVG